MRILYLFPHRLWQSKMSLGRVLYGEALARQPGIDLVWSGVGWPDFDPDRTVMENCGSADCVWVYQGEGLKGIEEYPVRLVCFNEANAPKTLDEIEAACANLVVFHHANDMPRWNLGDSVRTAHILHCADGIDAQPLSKRPVPVLLTGVTSKEVYPLRWRMRRLIETRQIPGKVRRHPGNRLRTHSHCRKQHRQYFQELASAKIVLCCSSVYRYPLQKYVEAISAGCAVVGDMPDDEEFQRTLGRCMISIAPDATDQDVCETVRHWLSRPQQLEELAVASREYVAENFTTDHYAQRLLNAICQHPGLTNRGTVATSGLPSISR